MKNHVAVLLALTWPIAVIAHEGFRNLPVSFEVNAGWADPRVKFVARASGYTLFLTSGDATLASPNGHLAVRIRLRGASPSPRVEGLDPHPGKSNFFPGNDPAGWRTSLPVYARVRYQGVYPGIDLIYHGTRTRLEYDFVVAPGADPGKIQLVYDGVEKVRLDDAGDLVVRTPGGEVRQHKPVVFQEAGGIRKTIPGRYVLQGKRQVAFRVASYDLTKPLVIDPVLSYSTLLGGRAADIASAIAVDASGDIYITGATSSFDFPIANAFRNRFRDPAAFKSTDGGSTWDSSSPTLAARSVFALAADPVTPTTVYAGTDNGVFKSTNAGSVWSAASSGLPAGTLGNHPAVSSLAINPTTTSTLYAATCDGVFKSTDAASSWYAINTGLPLSVSRCVEKVVVDPTVPSTLYAATHLELFKSVDAGNNWTQISRPGAAGVSSLAIDLVNPAILYAGVNLYPGGVDGLIKSTDGGRSWTATGLSAGVISLLAIDPRTPSTLYAGATTGLWKSTDAGKSWDRTTLPGSDVSALAIDSRTPSVLYAGAAEGVFKSTDGGRNWAATELTGSVRSLVIDPASSATLYAGVFTSSGDVAFVTKLNATGAALLYSTYLGAGQGLSIAVDTSGNAYVTGSTESNNFPTTRGAFQRTPSSGRAMVFVTKLNAAGNGLVYSTFLGGSSDGDQGHGIAVDASGNAYVTGITYSARFPTTPGAFQTAPGGLPDAFVTKLDAAGASLLYSTHLGGNRAEFAPAIAVDASGSAYIAGTTQSANFPTTADAYQVRHRSDWRHPFVTRLNAAGAALLYSTYLGGASADEAASIAVDAAGQAYVTGYTASADFPTTPGAFQTTRRSSEGAFVAKLNATGTALVYSTYLDALRGLDIAVDASGHAYVTGQDSDPSTGVSIAFVKKLNAAGSALLSSINLGGEAPSWGAGIVLDATGVACITGITSAAGFPTTPRAFQSTLSAASDAFVARISPAALPSRARD